MLEPRIKAEVSEDFETFPVLRMKFGHGWYGIGGDGEWLSLKFLKAGFHKLMGEARL